VLRHRKKETKERKEEKLERRDREIKTEHLVAWLNNSGSFSLLLPLEL
jgi:ribose 1,5-bisphosphokinase PhnN